MESCKRGLDFIDTQHGWAIASFGSGVDEIPNKIFETHDGGENWNRIARERGGCRRDHLQNRWSASLAMSTDGSFPSRPPPFFEFDPDIASYAVPEAVHHGSAPRARAARDPAVRNPCQPPKERKE